MTLAPTAWRRGAVGRKKRRIFCSVESAHLLLVAGGHYNLERVVRSLMRPFA
jgi:hypothetical protein